MCRPLYQVDPLGASTEAMAHEAQLGDWCPRFLRGPRTGFKNANGDTSQSCAPASRFRSIQLARETGARQGVSTRLKPTGPSRATEQDGSTLDSPPSRGVQLRAPDRVKRGRALVSCNALLGSSYSSRQAVRSQTHGPFSTRARKRMRREILTGGSKEPRPHPGLRHRAPRRIGSRGV